jgi:hypothetical protein
MAIFDLNFLNEPEEKEQLFTPNPDIQKPSAPAQPESSPFGFDAEKLNAQAEDVARKKRALALIGGIGDTLSSSNSYGNFWLRQMNPQSDRVSKTMSGLADTFEDPRARQAKLFEAYKQAKEAKQIQEQDAALVAKKDPNSNATKAARLIAKRFGIPDANTMTAFEIEQILDPKKMMETEASAQVNHENAKILQDRQFEQQKTMKEIDHANELRKEGVKADRDMVKDQLKEFKDKTKSQQEFKNRFKSINDEIAAVKDMIESKGTFEAFGDHNASLAQKIDSIAIDAAKLFDPQSVARESEVAAFKKMLFEPGTLTTKNSTAKGILDSFKNMIDRRAKSHIGEDISAQTVQVIAPNGQVKMIPQQEVAAALKAGGKLANKSNVAGGR